MGLLVASPSRYAYATMFVVLLVCILAPGQQVILPTFFGMHTNSAELWPTVPFNGLRLWDTETNWAKLCPDGPVCDFTVLDQWLALADVNGIDDVIYTFGRTPSWASSGPTDRQCSFSPGSCHPPSDLNPDGSGPNQIFRNFVNDLIAHVGDRITYWEIWNEPNVSAMWKGTPAQLARMAQDARMIILAVNPKAQFLSPAPTGVSAPTWMARYFNTGGENFADIIAFHPYLQTGPASIPTAEDVLPLVNGIQNLVANSGRADKPIWATEGGWGRTDVNGFTNPDLRSAFLARYYVLQASQGVHRLFWYAWANQSHGALFDPATGLESAGAAYEQVHAWLVGAALSSCTSNGAVWTCPLTRPGGYDARIMWDTAETCAAGSCGTRSEFIGSGFSQYRDLSGSTATISAGSVPIGAKPILVENQDPQPDFVVSVAPASSTIQAGKTAAFGIQLSASGVPPFDSVALSCSGLPVQTSCSFSPASLAVRYGVAKATVTINTSSAVATALPSFKLLDCAALLIFVASSFAKLTRMLPCYAAVVLPGIALIALVVVSGCGGGSSGSRTETRPIPLGTYQITVTATAQSSPATITHSQTVILVVK